MQYASDEKMMKNSRIEQLTKRLSMQTDSLGKPIDKGIFRTVLGLQYHDVNTISSCQGHEGRFTDGPYVMFEAKGVEQYRQQYQKIQDRSSPEYKQFFEKATMLNSYEVHKVLKLLQSFYAKKMTDIYSRLIITHFGPLSGRLMCQGVSIERILPEDKKHSLLKEHQAEMNEFADFLLSE